MTITHAVAAVAEKGGVGKTSVVCNVAYAAAAAGWRVLVVDLDPQGNCRRDLGYPQSDGQNLHEALTDDAALTPFAVDKNVVGELDVVPGGKLLKEMQTQLMLDKLRTPRYEYDALERALRFIEKPYDLILIDSPPTSTMIHMLIYAAVKGVIVPTRSDGASLDGITGLVDDIVLMRDFNPALEVYGAVICGVNPSASRIRGDVRNTLEEELGMHVFDTTIRYAETIAVDCRKRGLVVAEYQTEAAAATPWVNLSAEDRQVMKRHSTAAVPLALEYKKLSEEILTASLQSRGIDPGGAAQ